MSRSPRSGWHRGHLGVWLSAGVVVVVAALVSAVCATAAGSASQAAGLIAFTRGDGIYVMRPDGTGVRLLRRGLVASQALLDWSPDGRKLAFESGGGLWVMDADGKNLARLVAPLDVDGWEGGVHSPSWSPNGRRIAFSIGVKCCSKPRYEKVKSVWVVNADGSNVQRLLRLARLGTNIGVAEIDWSHDGRRFALSGHGGYLGWVYVVDADGTHLRRLSARGWAWDDSPEWSPDGRRIAYYGSPGTHIGPSTSEIYLVDPAGRSHTRLTSNRVADEHPTWSPDGQQIAYVHGGPYRTKPSEIYVINADGTGAKRLTTGRNPAWQPIPGTPDT